MKNNTILIIEDDLVIRESLKNILELEGFPVIAAEDGLRGLEKIQELTQPSMILLDLFMPRMSGVEFLKKYSKMQTQVPVILCTACPPDHEEYIEAKGYTGFSIKKPIDIDKVLELARLHCTSR